MSLRRGRIGKKTRWSSATGPLSDDPIVGWFPQLFRGGEHDLISEIGDIAVHDVVVRGSEGGADEAHGVFGRVGDLGD